MAQRLARYLNDTLTRELPALRAMTEERASAPVPEGKWTSKQELGHLLDSATNNRIRFVRAALEGKYEGPTYQQNDWVRIHDYNAMAWSDIVDMWAAYNKLLVHLVQRIPEEALDNPVNVYGTQTLGFMIDDYVLHMRHHLDHLIGREVVTQYPRAAGAP